MEPDVILTIDSATDTFGASLIKDGAILGEFCHQRPRGQLVHLFPSVLEMLRILGLGAREITLIGVTRGPGSFTGLRLGIVTARTMAQILDIPVVPLNTLDAISRNILFPNDRVICAMLDARRNEIFAAFYADEGNKRKNLSGYLVFTLEELIHYLRDQKGSFICTGNALSKYGGRLQDALQERIVLLPAPYWYPRAAGMLPLIIDACQEKKRLEYYEVNAFYMRKSDAEEKLEKWK